MAKDAANIAVIGAGRIALMHAAIIRQMPEAKLAGIVDRRGRYDRLQKAGLDGVKIYPNAEDAFADDDIDAVLIASSTPTHCAFVRAAAMAGKHVLCEKPVAFCAAEIDALARETAGCGSVIRVGFNRRFDADFSALRARLQSGEIGEAVLIHITNHDPQCPPPAFAKTAGGIFADFNVHDFDMLRFLTGA
ncbi:MAG: Gfo/Idh/MocA family oxidoreductase, partial [Gammaproteobacteria bacterium]